MTLILSGTNGVSDIDGDASTPALRGTDANSGVFFGSDVVGVSTDGTERMRVTSAGEVLVGGSTAIGSADGHLTIQNTNLAGNLNFFRNDTSVVNGNPFGIISFYGNDTTSNTPTRFAYIDVRATGDHSAGDNPTNISFGTTADGSDTVAERMQISPSGEVLVGGTTSLVSGNGRLSIQTSGNDNPVLNFYRDDTAVVSGNSLGVIRFWGNDTTSNTPTNLAYISAVASGTHAAGDNPTDLVFGCTNDGSETVAEFARLAQEGTAGRAFRLSQSTLVNGQSVEFIASSGTAGTINRFAQLGLYKHASITNSAAYLGLFAEDGAVNYLWADNSDVLRISTVSTNIGTTGGTVVGTQTSDERLKDISGPVTYGLNEVLAIEPIAFTMKDDPNIAKIGFSAQQVQPIVPEAVYDTKECIDGYTENEETKEQIPNSDRTKLAMEYTQLIPVLVNAVKELKAELDAVKETNTALEARLAALEAQ